MKFHGSKYFSKLSLLAALPLLLGILQCGPGTAIEQDALDTGEGIILKFDGPFTYEYKVKGNPISKSYTGSSEEQILLKNHFSDSDPQDLMEESLLAYAGITYDNKLSIALGPDPKLKTESGIEVMPAGWDQYYKEVAYITNTKHPEDGQLSMETPIEFSKNLVGITTVRREKICVDSAGNPVPSKNGSKTPSLSCNPGTFPKETGKILQFDYTVDQLKQLLGTSGVRKNSSIWVNHKGDPLTLTLQNVKEIKVALSPTLLGGLQVQGSTTQYMPFPPAGNVQNIPFPPAGNAPATDPGSSPADPENPAQPSGDNQGSVPIDSKVSVDATAPAPGGGASGGNNQAQDGAKGGCALTLGAVPTVGAGTGLAGLASILLGGGWIWRRRSR